jgi:Flp pilus assembly protein TadG
MTNLQPLPFDAPPRCGGLLRRLRRLLYDSCGTVAIEFAFALPILCGMTFALYEITEGVITYMKVVDVANTVSDLIGQQSLAESGIADQDLDNYYMAGEMVMAPNVGSNLKLAVASVYYDLNGANPTRCWHAERGGAAVISNATTFVNGLGTAYGSTIVVQATYTYTSLLNYFITNPIVISAEIVGQPRNLLPTPAGTGYTKGIPYPPSQPPPTQICSG